jgi:hypothetical protein
MYRTYGGVSALVIDNTILYAGGAFTTAGGKASPNFALCTLENTARVAYSRYEKRASSPFAPEAGTGRVRLHFRAAVDMEVRIHSLAGRIVSRSLENIAAGDRVYRLKTAGLAPGAYIAQIRAGSASIRWRIAKEK